MPELPLTDVKFSQIQAEWGGSDPIALSEYYSAPGTEAPASGQISVGDFAGEDTREDLELNFTSTSVPYVLVINLYYQGYTGDDEFVRLLQGGQTINYFTDNASWNHGNTDIIINLQANVCLNILVNRLGDNRTSAGATSTATSFDKIKIRSNGYTMTGRGEDGQSNDRGGNNVSVLQLLASGFSCAPICLNWLYIRSMEQYTGFPKIYLYDDLQLIKGGGGTGSAKVYGFSSSGSGPGYISFGGNGGAPYGRGGLPSTTGGGGSLLAAINGNNGGISTGGFAYSYAGYLILYPPVNATATMPAAASPGNINSTDFSSGNFSNVYQHVSPVLSPDYFYDHNHIDADFRTIISSFKDLTGYEAQRALQTRDNSFYEDQPDYTDVSNIFEGPGSVTLL